MTQTHITTCTSLLPGHTVGLHFPAALAVRHGTWLPSMQWNEMNDSTGHHLQIWPLKHQKKKKKDSQVYVIYKISTLNIKTAKLNIKEWRKICHENTNQSQVDSLYFIYSNTIWISAPQKQILRHKPNKICMRSTWGELWGSNERSQRSM